MRTQGVRATGKLEVRPPYQREFVYKDKQRVMTVRKDFRCNVMYWVKTDDNSFEVLVVLKRTLKYLPILQ